jgi:penicillin-binding protein 2
MIRYTLSQAAETTIFIQRLGLIAILVVVISALLMLRLVHLQVWQHSRYTTLSKQNQFELISIKPNRGLIYDRNGVVLAENVPVFVLEITPNHVKDLTRTVNELRQLLSIPASAIKHFHNQLHNHRPFQAIPLRLNLSETERAQFAVNRHKFPGVNVTARLIRHYPLGKPMAHVLGYVGRINVDELKTVDTVNYNGTNFIGKMGIERYYETLLHGTVGYEQAEINANGQIIRVLQHHKPIAGSDLYLTVDSRLQTEISLAMQYHRGAVVALDPSSGDVLAMVSSPSFDPNPFVQGINQTAYKKLNQDPNQPLFNRAIRGQYALASTVKPFLAVRALEDEIVTPKTRIWDRGYYQLPNNNHIYHDWKRGGHGWVNLRRAITVSCDTYFYALANRMGITRIAETLRQFGFGARTKLDLNEELPGLVPTPKWKRAHRGHPWYTGDTLITGIGQGFVLTTPIQLANATAMLASHGIKVRPHLLHRIQTPHQGEKTAPPIQETPITLNNEHIWDFVTQAMENVINHYGGTGFRFGRDTPYTLAAKTGTSQVVSNPHPYTKQKLPEHLRDHSLFIAFAPTEKPRIALAIVVENSNIASNLARRVLDFYLLGKHHPIIQQQG